MKVLYFATVSLAVVISAGPSLAQKAKAIGKCMRADCASMQAYCEESKSAGKTGTDCPSAGARCLASKGKTWVGTTPDGKKWSCTF
jgi:hypothetical protein